MTVLVNLKKSDISGRRVGTAKKTGTTNISSKSNFEFHSEAKETRCSFRVFSFPNKVDEIDIKRFLWLI